MNFIHTPRISCGAIHIRPFQGLFMFDILTNRNKLNQIIHRNKISDKNIDNSTDSEKIEIAQ